jgi:Domain of unknown function (DUF4388)
MSLAGNLRTMSLPDILQWIASGRKTGTLHLERRSIDKRIIFSDGTIYSSWSNDPRESLGQFLIRDRYVTEEQLFRALLAQEKEGRLLGSILVSEGTLTEDNLKKTLNAKVEETVYDLFLWTEGQFEFKDNEIPEDVLIHVDMPVTRVILEGIRRVDEWERIREAFPSMRTTFRVTWIPHAVEDPDERHAMGLAAAGKSIAEISLEMRRSLFDAAALMFDLLNRGAVTVDKVEDDPKDIASDDPLPAIGERLTRAYQFLQDRRYDEAVAAYEEVLKVDRLNQNAKKGLIAVSEARGRDRAVKSVPLDRIPALQMDLATLTKENFEPQEGFVLSRVNGEWDVKSILKLCPMGEEAALLIFARLLERKVIELREP